MPVPVQDVGGGFAPEVAAAVVGSEGVEALQDENDSQVVAGAEEVAADALAQNVMKRCHVQKKTQEKKETEKENEKEKEKEKQKRTRARSAGSRRRIRARGPPR